MMKNATKNICLLIIVISMLFTTTGCEDLLNNPMKDKDSGENITLLLLDLNFIDTKLQFWFVDSETNEPIENELIELQVWGVNGDRLITFRGKKPELFSTSIGYLELGYDPNYEVRKDDPLSITIMAVSKSGISAPQFLSYTTEGAKDIIISMNKLLPGAPLKSGSTGEPYDMYYNDEMNSSELLFVSDISGSPTGTGYEYINLYTTLAQGNLLCDNLQDPLAYDDYGVYYTSNISTDLVPPAAPVREVGLAQGDLVFSSILKSGVAQCETGLTIRLVKAEEVAGTGSFNYLITYSTGDTKSGLISGSFPLEILIEPLYYNESAPAVQVQVFGDSQYDIPSNVVNLATPCGEIAEFIVVPKSNLHTYKFITQYVCPDSPIGIALSVNGQFRKAESGDYWTSFEFIEGICELELEQDGLYEFRVAIDGVYHYYTLPTNPTGLVEFLEENEGEDYTILELAIIPMDEKTEITAVIEVTEEICEILSGGGWER